MLSPEDLETYTPLEEKLYDVTNYLESGMLFLIFPFAGWCSKSLYLDDQEAVLKVSSCCGTFTERRPYAQLGSVDKLEKLGICVTISSDLARVNEKGEGGISPGCGCDHALVDELVQTLQHRKLLRGNVAQMRKLDYLYKKVVSIGQQLPEVMKELEVPHTPRPVPQHEAPATFEDKTYDVTSYIEFCLACKTKSLTLTQEEAVLNVGQCGGILENFQSSREYAQLHHVDLARFCLCGRATNSGLGTFSPGWGCDNTKVSEITEELQSRMYARGTVGQIRKQEKMMKTLATIADEIYVIQRHLGIQYPPDDPTLAKILGGIGSVTLPPSRGGQMQDVNDGVHLQDLDQQVSNKTYNITNYCEAVLGLILTLGALGWTTKRLELGSDETFTTEENNCGSLTVKTPYAQMGNVDYERSCFCCHLVNTESNTVLPGWGCSQELVEEITEELQARKVKRGNIAQVKQLERMQQVSLEVDIKTELILDSKSIPYPPDAETKHHMYGDNVPLILTRPPNPPHVNPGAKFPLRQYDVSNHCLSGLLFLGGCGLPGPCTRITMTLEEEEMSMRTVNWCLQKNKRTPYAHLGSVDTSTCCVFCSSLPELAVPGCGCSQGLVKEIAEELQERKVKRGNIAQIKIQENIMNEVLKTGVKLDLLLHHLRNRSHQ